MAAYPDDIFDQRTLANIVGVTFDATKQTRIFAEDLTDLGDELTAIEATLGLNPEGSFDTVDERLASLGAGGSDNQIQVKESGVLSGSTKLTFDPSTCAFEIHNPSAANSTLVLSRDSGISLKLKSQDAQTRITTPGGSLLIDTDDAGTLIAAFTQNQRLGIQTASPTEALDVNSNAIRVRNSRTPSSASATGTQGTICWDSSFIYICTATNTWKRVAISTW